MLLTSWHNHHTHALIMTTWAKCLHVAMYVCKVAWPIGLDMHALLTGGHVRLIASNLGRIEVHRDRKSCINYDYNSQ